jgi:hypothetical protein
MKCSVCHDTNKCAYCNGTGKRVADTTSSESCRPCNGTGVCHVCNP